MYATSSGDRFSQLWWNHWWHISQIVEKMSTRYLQTLQIGSIGLVSGIDFGEVVLPLQGELVALVVGDAALLK